MARGESGYARQKLPITNAVTKPTPIQKVVMPSPSAIQTGNGLSLSIANTPFMPESRTPSVPVPACKSLAA
jgi:hypothetical protein